MTFTEGMAFGDFLQDKKTQNADIRSLEIMGEAVKKIPETIRLRYPGLPWRQMSGTRDKLIHEYHGVDLSIIWAVIEDELPKIMPAIDAMARDFASRDD